MNKYSLICANTARDFGRGGVVYMVKVNDHNVYRIFLDTDANEMIFQQVQYAFDVHGKEFYDEAVDYGWVKGRPGTWFHWISKWFKECETRTPEFTIYE